MINNNMKEEEENTPIADFIYQTFGTYLILREMFLSKTVKLLGSNLGYLGVFAVRSHPFRILGE